MGFKSKKIVGVDPILSYDVISNEFKKASSDIHESNTESDNETTEDNSAILYKFTLIKHHIVIKFTPFDNELKKSSFIVSSESVSKVTPSKIGKYGISFYKDIRCLGGFQVYGVVADGATEKNLSLNDLQHSLSNHTFQLIWKTSFHQSIMILKI